MHQAHSNRRTSTEGKLKAGCILPQSLLDLLHHPQTQLLFLYLPTTNFGWSLKKTLTSIVKNHKLETLCFGASSDSACGTFWNHCSKSWMMYEMKNPCSLHTIQIVKSPWSIKKSTWTCHFIFVLYPEDSLISPQEHADTSAITGEWESTPGAKVDGFSLHRVSRKRYRDLEQTRQNYIGVVFRPFSKHSFFGHFLK